MEIVVIIFIACIVIVVIVNDKKSSKLFYIKRIEELKKEVEGLMFLREYQEERLKKSNILEVEHREKTDIEKEKAKSILMSIEQKYGHQISLREFILVSVINNGVNFTKKNYGVFLKTFDLNNRNISDAYQIYSEVFNDLPDQLDYEQPKMLPINLNV